MALLGVNNIDELGPQYLRFDAGWQDAGRVEPGMRVEGGGMRAEGGR